jgi:hypothetical protein
VIGRVFGVTKVFDVTARSAGHRVMEVDLAVRSIPVLGAQVPGRRLGLGLAVFLDKQGDDILEYLGDDVDERAERICKHLDGCTDSELQELLEAMQLAFLRRAEQCAADEAADVDAGRNQSRTPRTVPRAVDRRMYQRERRRCRY